MVYASRRKSSGSPGRACAASVSTDCAEVNWPEVAAAAAAAARSARDMCAFRPEPEPDPDIDIEPCEPVECGAIEVDRLDVPPVLALAPAALPPAAMDGDRPSVTPSPPPPPPLLCGTCSVVAAVVALPEFECGAFSAPKKADAATEALRERIEPPPAPELEPEPELDPKSAPASDEDDAAPWYGFEASWRRRSGG
jgi:hypothetical protein